jgi:MFS family permease
LAAPLLLALCRFGQGIGLGGEWGGAILLAIENAPPGKRAWYGMFPQLGAPIGFFLSSAVFLILSRLLSDKQFFDFGWRLPFLASALLVFLGLYVRLTITETPVFQKSLEQKEQHAVPMLSVLRHHFGALLSGIAACIATFVLFYLMIVFALSWGTTALGYPRSKFLLMQLGCVALFAVTIPLSALLAEHGRRRVMITVTIAIAVFGGFLGPMFSAGTVGAVAMMALGLSLMGITYAPVGTLISELFPTAVRYTGSSLAFSLAGILGASLAPSIATWLARSYGINFVGYYLSAAAIVTLIGLLTIRETKDQDLAH